MSRQCNIQLTIPHFQPELAVLLSRIDENNTAVRVFFLELRWDMISLCYYSVFVW